jgi:hypothetical protein
MSTTQQRRVPILLWPVYFVWRMVSFVLEAVGRVACVVLGFILLATGIVVSLTLVGVPIGIPLAAIGTLLMLRAFF